MADFVVDDREYDDLGPKPSKVSRYNLFQNNLQLLHLLLDFVETPIFCCQCCVFKSWLQSWTFVYKDMKS